MSNLISLSRLENWFDFEPFVVGGVVAILAWAFYFLFLKNISEQRHHNLRKRFRSFATMLAIFALLSLVYWVLKTNEILANEWNRIFIYWAILTVYMGAFAVIRLAQICLYLYLFFSHLKVGVPRLIANSFTFLFAVILLGWMTSEIFAFNVTHLLATSAIFSVVLGLALQDTLGNLISGFALQIDRPYSIGDWVEVNSAGQKWVGQIQEITWRATMLVSFSEELVLIPNKNMAQSQVLILSHQRGSARCHHLYRFDFKADSEIAKNVLLAIYLQHGAVLKDPPPRILITELAESYLVMKVFFSVSEFALKYRIGDELYRQALAELKVKKLSLAVAKMQLIESPAVNERLEQ